LFQRRVDGDDALLRLARLRFAGRVAGLVVHDKAEMATRTGDLVAGIGELDLPPDGPVLLLEYAAGLELDWFVEVAERLREVPRVGACVDVGHVGIAQARASFSRAHPGLDLAALDPGDGRLPGLAADVQAAVASALPAALGLLRSLGEVGKPIHLHLHDGHPLIPGLSDHFSFLIRVPVPFDHQGRRSFDPLYGPAGLAAIVRAAVAAGGRGTSLTLEIHQAEGRRPSATPTACSGTGETAPTPSG
jgi:hypothetical protein